MRLLLDTHTLLWYYGGDESLPVKLKQFIGDPTTICYISAASLWEITIKIGLGKLEIGTSLFELFQFLDRNRFWVMAIQFDHLLKLQQLPYYHKDPFDRIMIAQALSENLAVATKDSFFSQYGLTTIW